MNHVLDLVGRRTALHAAADENRSDTSMTPESSEPIVKITPYPQREGAAVEACPRCGQPVLKCVCSRSDKADSWDQAVADKHGKAPRAWRQIPSWIGFLSAGAGAVLL